MSWMDQHDDMAGAFAAVAKLKTVEVQPFRDAMCRLGAAVHVVTTDGPAGKSGFTATAVCSVSDAPATLLMCINRGASSMPVLRPACVLVDPNEPCRRFFDRCVWSSLSLPTRRCGS